MSAGHHHDSEALHVEAARRLDAVQSRYTTKRRLLVDVFEQADHPLSLPEVIAADSSLAQSSVYRNLAALEEAGVVRRIVTGDDFARFELAEELSGHHHHHLICRTCGTVADFTLPTAVERSLAATFRDVSDAHGFSVEDHQVDMVGVCADCQDAERIDGDT